MTNNQNIPVICALATSSHLHLALTMADSFILHHPHGKVFILQVGGEKMSFPTRHNFLTIVDLSELNADAELNSMRKRYDAFEFCNALKPYFLKYLLERTDYSKICYFDSDLFVLGNLEQEIFAKMDDCSIMLTPHYIKLSEKNDEETFQRELNTIIRGVYNAGFVGIRRNKNAHSFVKWWKEKVFRACYKRPEEGIFVDQRWLDIVPSFDLNTKINRYPGLNVAFWNLHERKISLENGKFLVNEKPLLFFHFSGYSPEKPDTISKFNQLRFSNFPHLREIFDGYAEALTKTKLELEQQLMQEVLSGCYKNNTKTSVSLIISNSDNEKFLNQTVESVLQQTALPTEIIVIDKIATHKSHRTLKNCDEKITFIKTKNISSIRNKLIRKAKGEFIIFLKAGDYFLFPTVLEEMISAFRQENYSFVVGGWREIRKNNEKFSEYLLWEKAPLLTLKEMLSMFFFNPSAVMFRRSHLLKIGGFKPNLFQFDFLDCCLRLKLSGFSSEWVKRVIVACQQMDKKSSKTVEVHFESMQKFADTFFQDEKISQEILHLAEKIRFDWIVWFANRFYQTGDTQAMKKALLESLHYTNLSVRGALVYWFSKFSRIAREERKPFDSFDLLNSREWQELESLQFEDKVQKAKT